MAAQPMILNLRGGLEVKARRRLGEEGAFESLLDDLQQQFGKLRESNPEMTPMIADFDISQNRLTQEQFEALFTTLTSIGAKVLRYRLFGSPTLNDEVMRTLADHFRTLSRETAPTEMHLSDCAITAEGFTALMDAIEEGDLYPTWSAGGKGPPLYMRLENNYIAEASLQEKVDLGVLRPMTKAKGGRLVDSSSAVKVDLIVRDNGSFQQKLGEPPKPEDAAPPKPVFDKYEQSQQQGKGGCKGGQAYQSGPWGWPQQQQAWRPPSWQGGPAWQPGARPGAQAGAAAQALPGMAGNRPVMMAPQAGRPGGAQAAAPIRAWGAPGGVTRPQNVAAAAANGGKGAQQGKGYAKNSQAVDRSRTPVGRTMAAARPPAAPPPAAEELPHPWEEHFSEEYNIPYYWNSESGDSLWEKPSVWPA